MEAACVDAMDFVISGEGRANPYPYGATPPSVILDAEFGCDHRNQRLTCLICSNGVRQFKMQCVRCGVGSQAVKHGALSKADRDSAPPFDYGLRESWWEARQARGEELREQFEPIRLALRQMKYEDVMNSGEWKERRRLLFEKAGGLCEDCGLREPVHAHHRTYERLGNELPEDLEALCFDCHAARHPHMREDEDDE